jgi:hypothetical protein
MLQTSPPQTAENTDRALLLGFNVFSAMLSRAKLKKVGLSEAERITEVKQLE